MLTTTRVTSASSAPSFTQLPCTTSVGSSVQPASAAATGAYRSSVGSGPNTASYSAWYRRAICCAANSRELLSSAGSSSGVKGWLNAESRRPSQLRNELCATSRSDLARRCVQPEPSEICARVLLVSEKPEAGTWQLTQPTLPVSPRIPSVAGSPLFASSKSGPENRVSKNSFFPSTAARGSSRYALVG